MSLLYSSSFLINITRCREYDISIYLFETVTNIHDIIVDVTLPNVTYFNIILNPFVDVNFNNFNTMRKGDNPWDFLVTDKKSENDSIIHMNVLGRNLKYYKDKSQEFLRPLANAQEIKPITQNISQESLEKYYAMLKFKSPISINLGSGWDEGVFVSLYERTTPTNPTSFNELTSCFNLAKNINYGIWDGFDIVFNTGKKYSAIYSCWMYCHINGNWTFSIDGQNSIDLIINDSLSLYRYGEISWDNNYQLTKTVNLSEGLYKIVIRQENTSMLNDGIKLQFKEPSNNTWKSFNVKNLQGKATLLSYIPSVDDMSSSYLITHGLTKQPDGDMVQIDNCEYILIKYVYLTQYLNFFKNNLLNVKNKGLPIADSTNGNTVLNGINDNKALSMIGWGNNNTNTIPGTSWIGYNFSSNPIELLKEIEWYEQTDDNRSGGWTDEYKRSSQIIIELTHNDGITKNVNVDMVDLEQSINIMKIDKNGIFYKISNSGLTKIVLKNSYQRLVSYIKIKRMDTDSVAWGLVTEINIKCSNCLDFHNIYKLIDANNIELDISTNSYTPIKFSNIPADNKIGIYKTELETIFKALFLVLYFKYDSDYITKIPYSYIKQIVS